MVSQARRDPTPQEDRYLLRRIPSWFEDMGEMILKIKKREKMKKKEKQDPRIRVRTH
jgi:hypothetical protein